MRHVFVFVRPVAARLEIRAPCLPLSLGHGVGRRPTQSREHGTPRLLTPFEPAKTNQPYGDTGREASSREPLNSFLFRFG
jgi:hypothetical protein